MWETDSPLKQIPHFEPDVSRFHELCFLWSWSRLLSPGCQEMQRCGYRISIRCYGNGGWSTEWLVKNVSSPNVNPCSLYLSAYCCWQFL
jgi:hypothetical protein